MRCPQPAEGRLNADDASLLGTVEEREEQIPHAMARRIEAATREFVALAEG